jgi:hypothetical protein
MKNDDKSVDIQTKRLNKLKKENELYNYDVASDEFKMKDPNYKFTNSKEIPIGTKDPVMKFKQWKTEYWKKKTDFKKDEN